MSQLKLRQQISACMTAIAPTTTHHIHHNTKTILPLSPPIPKNPQHLLSLLLKNPSHYQSLQQLHSHIITSGLFHTNPCLLLFNNLIRSYSLSPFPLKALNFTTYTIRFNSSFTYPFLDSYSFAFMAHACANSGYTQFGFQLHSLVFKVGFHCHVYVQTGLVRMYSNWGFLVYAAQVFGEMPLRNTVTWNVFINGLVMWGQVEVARSLFERMTERSVVSWTLVIDGYTRLNKPEKALALYRKMVEVDGIEPSEVTLLTVFPAIANLGYIKMCRSVHGYAEKRGFRVLDIRITNALIDLYAKCGCMESARRFFEEIPEWRKNSVSWNSVISGFAMYGMGREAMENFGSMEKAGFRPNRVAFLSVLSACSHGGLVEEGLEYFSKMVNDYQIEPDIKHYGCVIDMLGRAGRLDEAEKVALQVPHEIANDVIWRTLLGACSVHNNVEIGQRVTQKIVEMERQHGGDYVLMSNIFAGVGRFKDVEGLRKMIDKRNAFKQPGYSLL